MDRDFLFGVLAVQLGQATPQQVMAAASAYFADRSRSISERLRADGTIAPDRFKMIQDVVATMIQAHGGDARKAVDTLGERAVYASFGGSLVVDDKGGLSIAPKSEGGDTGAEDTVAVEPEAPGRYRLEANAEIGRGGIGRVLVAFDEFLGREIAVKELLGEAGGSQPTTPRTDALSRTSAVVARFLREARVTGQLEHPNIVPVYEVGRRADGTFYYTMKLVRGRTMSKAIKACGSLGDRLKLLHHYVDLCNAVAYAHSRGVVHRDLKTENVMLGEFGETVVLDWGLAKVQGKKDIRGGEIARELAVLHDAKSGHTVDGSAIGTPAYMSPEQADGRVDEIDARSDVWSLGAVLFEILTGRPPFEGYTPYEIMGKVLKDEVVAPKVVNAEVPAELSAVACKALTRDKAQRYQKAGDLSSEVQAYMTGGRISAYEYSSLELLKGFVAKHKVATALVGIIFALVVASSVVLYWAYQRAESEKARAEASAAEARQQETQTRVRELEAELNLAKALEEKAQRLFVDKLFQQARIYAATSLVHNPGNPKAPHFADGFSETHPECRALLTSAASLYLQSEQRSLLRSETRSKSDIRLGIGSRGWGGLIAWPQGDVWAVVAGDGTVRVGGRDGSTRLTLRDDAPMTVVAAKGAWIATGGEDGVVRIWEAATGNLTTKLAGSSAAVRALAVSADGSYLAASYRDGTLKAWTVPEFAPAWQRSTGLPVLSLAFAPAGGRVCGRVAQSATANASQTACWDLLTGRDLQTASGSPQGATLSFSPDGAMAASVAPGITESLVWEIASGKEIARLPIGGEGHSASFSGDGALLMTAGNDGVLRLWDTRDWSLATAVNAYGGFFEATFSADGREILAVGSDGYVSTWHVVADRLKSALVHESKARAIAISPDSKRLASGALDANIRLWNLENRTLERLMQGHSGMVWTLQFGRSSDILYSGALRDSRILRLNLDTGAATPLRIGGGASADPALIAGETQVATAFLYEDGVEVVDLADGRIIRRLDGKYTAAVSPDERSLATTRSSAPTRLFVYDLASGAVAVERDANADGLYVAKYSWDGKRLATGGLLGSLLLWDTSSYGAPKRFVGHTNWINRMDFSPDGSLLATASDDATVRIWSVESGATMIVLRTANEVAAVRFMPDGKSVVLADDNAVRFYSLDFSVREADPRALLERAEREAGLRLEGFSLVPLEAK